MPDRYNETLSDINSRGDYIMTVRITTNLNKRIQLLKEDRNYIQVLVNNGIQVPKKLLTTYKEDVKICKELLKQELIKAPINKL